MLIPTIANGKTYLANTDVSAHDTMSNGVVVSLSYFSTRNGERFGPIRTASTLSKPKTAGGQIAAQVFETLNVDTDAMIAEATRLTAEFKASGRDGWYPSVKLIERS